MKKFLLLFCISILSFSGAQSQVWSATLKSIDGLPGEANAYYGELYYTFNSKVFTPGGTLDIIRLTVVETYSNEKPNGNSAIFALSELTVYDGDGNEVPYTASSNADHNSLSWQQDGGGLAAFLEINRRAPVYLSQHAFGAFYNGTEKYIGLNPALQGHPRFISVGNEAAIGKGLTLYSCNHLPRPGFLGCFGLMQRAANGDFEDDPFLHEQYLLRLNDQILMF